MHEIGARSKSGPTVAQRWRVTPNPPDRKRQRAPNPLDADGLERLALHYCGRFATTRAKLATYLARKIGERGWAGERPADVAGLVARIADLGYVDDRLYAEARGAALGRRGYGARRVGQALTGAGIAEEDRAPAAETAAAEAWPRALAFARRRRIGPFAAAPADRAAREKQLAAFVRAGHPFDLARRIVDTAPGGEPGEPA